MKRDINTRLSTEEFDQQKKYFEDAAAALAAEMHYDNLKQNRNRARGITVGTAFGGTTEVSMRSNNGDYVWATLQPVETMELLHQLAANVGCHIAVKPREDFGSWRKWFVPEDYKKQLSNFPPFADDMDPFRSKGTNVPHIENQQELQVNNLVDETGEKNETMATKKTINKRSSKRTPKAT